MDFFSLDYFSRENCKCMSECMAYNRVFTSAMLTGIIAQGICVVMHAHL